MAPRHSAASDGRKGRWWSASDRRVPILLLACYLLILVMVGLWATAVDAPVSDSIRAALEWLRGRGVTAVRYGHVEAVANVMLFVPLGILGALALGSRSWWWVVLAALLVSTSIEVAQLGLSGRTSHGRDIVANTAGAFAGAVLVATWRKVGPRGRQGG